MESEIFKNKQLEIIGNCTNCGMPVLGVLGFSFQPDVKTCKCKIKSKKRKGLISRLFKVLLSIIFIPLVVPEGIFLIMRWVITGEDYLYEPLMYRCWDWV